MLNRISLIIIPLGLEKRSRDFKKEGNSMFEGHIAAKKLLQTLQEIERGTQYDKLMSELCQVIDSSSEEGISIENELKEAMTHEFKKDEIKMLLQMLLKQARNLRISQRDYMFERRQKDSKDKEKAGKRVASQARKLDVAISFVEIRLNNFEKN